MLAPNYYKCCLAPEEALMVYTDAQYACDISAVPEFRYGESVFDDVFTPPRSISEVSAEGSIVFTARTMSCK